jgi:hypothetical protein
VTEATEPQPDVQPDVVTCGELPPGALAALFGDFGVAVEEHPEGAEIPGSYWGAPEAGIVGKSLHVRPDTPVHSALHEGCHIVCAAAAGREGLDTDAGGTDGEENAVCYLQVLVADLLAGIERERLMADMDAWGYSYRLGSTRAWFERDAEDAREWLIEHHLLAPAPAV